LTKYILNKLYLFSNSECYATFSSVISFLIVVAESMWLMVF